MRVSKNNLELDISSLYTEGQSERQKLEENLDPQVGIGNFAIFLFSEMKICPEAHRPTYIEFQETFTMNTNSVSRILHRFHGFFNKIHYPSNPSKTRFQPHLSDSFHSAVRWNRSRHTSYLGGNQMYFQNSPPRTVVMFLSYDGDTITPPSVPTKRLCS